jgi:UMF1 family MFS transporter
MVGLWWFGFALIPFRVLPNPPSLPLSKELLWKGVAELRKVAAVANRMPNLKTFLASFFFYSAGVQTVMFLAATFAEKELKLATAELILVVLIIQLVAIGGAYLFARLSERYGNKPSLLAMLLIWIAICVYAYFMQSPLEFYGVAASVGLVMGGIQSLSRSTYSKLLPASTHDTASFFSFYDVLEKTAIVLGSFTFGYLDQLTGSMRTSILVLCAFFMIGSVLLVNVQVPKDRA